MSKSFIKFVHMKPKLQNWSEIPSKWTNKVSFSVNNQGNLLVDNIIQDNIFHYVEDEILNENIIRGIET